MTKILHKNIKDLRIRNGYSQEKLAEIVDVSTGAVSKWESGETSPDLNNLIKLAELFGVSIDFLIGFELEPKGTHYYLRSIKKALKNNVFTEYEDIIDKGLKFYPNNLEIVYRSALFYVYYGMYENKQQKVLKGIKLLYKSLDIFEYNDKFIVSKQQIIRELANAYSSINQTDKSISLLKENNEDEQHDILIGVYLSSLKESASEALDYLSKSYIKNITSTLIILDGMVDSLKNLKMYKKAYDLLLWYEDFVDSIKTDNDSFFNNIKVIIIANQAILRLALSNDYDSNNVEDLIKKCKVLILENCNSYGTENSFKYYYGNETIDIFGDNDLQVQIKRIELDGYTEQFREMWKSVNID